jgi:hypothetical protein
VIDPLAEVDNDMTPYHFGLNNPVFCSDPSGMNVINDDDGVTFDGADAQSFFKAYLNILNGAKEQSFDISGEFYDFSTGGSGIGDKTPHVLLPQITVTSNSNLLESINFSSITDHHAQLVEIKKFLKLFV